METVPTPGEDQPAETRRDPKNEVEMSCGCICQVEGEVFWPQVLWNTNWIPLILARIQFFVNLRKCTNSDVGPRPQPNRGPPQ
jgi:hypothetical protein